MAEQNKKVLIASVFFLSSTFAFATEQHINFFDAHKNSINLYAKNNLIKITYSNKKISIDNESKKIFSKMDSMAIISNKSFLIDANQFFWLFIRIPSKNSMGAGYCGAGFEDYIYLFEIKKNKLRYIDKFQAQSCLNNFSIGVDSIDDVSSNVFISSKNNDIEISQESLKEDKVIAKKIRLKAMNLKIETEVLVSK